MLGWSVALRVSTPGSPTFLSHHRRPAALFRSFHTIPSPVGRSAVLLPPATSIRDANPPYRVPSLPLPLCARLYFSLCLSLSLLLYLSDPRRSPSRFLSLSHSIPLPFPLLSSTHPLSLILSPSLSFGYPALAAALNATSCPQPRPQPQIARACQIAVHHGSLCRLQIDSRRRSGPIVPAVAEQPCDLRTRSLACSSNSRIIYTK